MKIEIKLDTEINLYIVSVDKVTILECLSENEVDSLTIKEIKRCVEMSKRC